FVAGTPIATTHGDVAIERLAPGDALFAYDVDARAKAIDHVLRVSRRDMDDVGTILLSNGTELRVTREHPFFVPGRGFVAAGDLGPGDPLLSRDGSAVRVLSSSEFVEKATVYNVSAEAPHDYFAGGVLVHNY